MDTSFGHWLSGLIDGEGCFRVHKGKRGAYYATHFALKLRDDDTPVLREIWGQTGFGVLKPDRTRSGNSNPCMAWVIQSKADCLRLVELLDKYPLRSRKARDYVLWREAVEVWVSMNRGNRWHGPRDWSPMIRLKEAIEDARSYRPPSHHSSPPPNRM